MADLMTSVWEFEKLQTQYKDFKVPAVAFSVGGTDLVKGTAALVSVEAVLCMDGASSVKVEFGNCYDVKNGSYDSKIKSAAVPGKKVELQMGYNSSLLKIFQGYLSNVRMRASAEDGFGVEFTALDVRRLMMTDNSHARQYKIKNYSDAVSEILKRYAKLAQAKVDATDENMQDGLVWQYGSDYDFITGELIGSGRVDREFFAAVDTVYFRKPQSVTSPVIKLKPGGGLISLETDTEYKNVSYEVQGFDPAAHNPVSGKAEAKTAGEMADALGGAGKIYVTDPECTSATRATAVAQSLARQAMEKTQKASIRCIGLPELIPGRFIQIERVDSLVNKKYYITRVTHTFNREGFRTALEAEGWG